MELGWGSERGVVGTGSSGAGILSAPGKGRQLKKLLWLSQILLFLDHGSLGTQKWAAERGRGGAGGHLEFCCGQDA